MLFYGPAFHCGLCKPLLGEKQTHASPRILHKYAYTYPPLLHVNRINRDICLWGLAH